MTRRTTWPPAAARCSPIGVLPVWTASAVLLLSAWPWQAAIGHLIVLGLLGAIFAELGLRGVQKIPFTCSYLPGKSSFHVAFWVFLMIAVPIVMWASSLEQEALDDPIGYVVMLTVLTVILLAARLVDVAAGDVGGRAAAVRGGSVRSGRGAERVGRPEEPAARRAERRTRKGGRPSTPSRMSDQRWPHRLIWPRISPPALKFVWTLA